MTSFDSGPDVMVAPVPRESPVTGRRKSLSSAALTVTSLLKGTTILSPVSQTAFLFSSVKRAEPLTVRKG